MSATTSPQKPYKRSPSATGSFLQPRRRKRRTKLSDVLGATSLRIYGAFFLTYGALTVFLHLFRFLVDSATTEETILNPLICGFTLVALSIPFFISEKPLWKIALEISFFRFIFFDYFCLPHSSLHAEKGVPLLLSMTFGALFSVFGFFTSPLLSAMALLGLLILFCAVSAPEMPFFLSILFFPVFTLFENGTHVICALILICFFAYFRKLLTGRRKASLSFYDIGFAVYGLLVLLSGILGEKQSLVNSLFLLCFLLSCPIVRNLLTNRRLLTCALGSFTIGSLFASVLTILRSVLSWIGDYRFSHPMLNTVADALLTVEERFFSVYLLCAFFACMYFLREKTAKFFFVCNSAALLFLLVALVFSQDYFALFALGAASLILWIYRFVKKTTFLLILTVLLPIGVLIVPNVIPLIAPLAAKTKLAFDVYAIPSLFPLLFDRLLVGFGIGNGLSASALYDACQTIPFDSLFLPLLLDTGVLATVCFFATLLYRPIHIHCFDVNYGYHARDYGVITSSAAAFAILALGVFRFPFLELCMFYPFFVMFSLGAVAMSNYASEVKNRAEAKNFQAAANEATADVFVRRH